MKYKAVMKNRVTIHMGASRFDVILRNVDGKPITFDLNHMSKDDRRVFHKAFMKAYREANK
jgi:hypothetical protein